MNALVLLHPDCRANVYGPAEEKRLAALFGAPPPFHSAESIAENPGDLAGVEYLFTGWGMPRCDAAFLDAAPHLKALFYAAGSVKPFATEALWEREIVVTTANRALALTVAEFALGEILLALKGAWHAAAATRTARTHIRVEPPGIYGSTVGIVSLGAIARHLVALLRPFGVGIVVHDPFLGEEAARELGVERASLDEVFERADVVSLHTPWLPETEGMIRGRHLEKLRPGATFINTARGALVNEAELIAVLRQRPDLHALLDVTHPEPPPPDSPLYTLPNVLLTPHMAGATGRECRRLGAMAVDEYERLRNGEPLLGEVKRDQLSQIA